jgi:hypothetical protein
MSQHKPREYLNLNQASWALGPLDYSLLSRKDQEPVKNLQSRDLATLFGNCCPAPLLPIQPLHQTPMSARRLTLSEIWTIPLQNWQALS